MNDLQMTLLIDSYKLTGWKSIEVNKSLNNIADSFTISLVDIWENNNIDSILLPNKQVKIFAEKNDNGSIMEQQLLCGYIDKIDIGLSNNQSNINISGRSLAGDIVDSSAKYDKKNSWNNKSLVKIIRDLLDQYNISLDFVSSTAYSQDTKLSLTINTGESVYEIIDRECKKRGIIAVSNPYGNIELITTGDKFTRDKLILGENIKNPKISFDYSNRFGSYVVKGQKESDGFSWQTETKKISFYGEATDTIFDTRIRNKSIVLDSAGSVKDAQNYARWESQVRAGKTGLLTLSIPNWFQSDNTLWEIGTIVYCDISPLKIQEELLIQELIFSQSNTGSLTNMSLIHADTYKQNPVKENEITKKSNKTGFGFGF